MKTLAKLSLAAGVSVLALAAGAHAQSTDDLEARLAQLEAMVAELRGELEAARSQEADTEDRIERLESREAETPPVTAAASPPGSGFRAGTTRITYGGFIDVDAHLTALSNGDINSGSIARSFYIPGATPVSGPGESEPDFDFTAQASRFFFATKTPTDLGEITSRIEFDFLGSPGGDERVSNSYNPRMRVAWAEFGGWRVGQDWSTFQNTAAIPESASFLAAPDGMIFVRQPQMRFTRGPLQLALENPETTYQLANTTGMVSGDGALPDFVARYNFGGERSNIALTGLARRLSADVAAGEDEAFGWGVSIQGRTALTDTSDLRFSLTGGKGVGRYIGLNAAPGAVLTAAGELKPIAVIGGLLAWRQEIGGGRRFNIGVSALEADNDVALTGLATTKSVRSAFGALLVPVAPGVTLGGEILYGERELESGLSGSITRATVSTKYTF
ncbi:MAG: DcaP family trimeric outer membrane transporter [Oceanicaulis sp.]